MAEQIPLKLTEGSPNKVERFESGDTLAATTVGVTGGVPVGTTQTQTLTNKTLTDPKINRLFAANDSTDAIAELLGTASAVNHLIVQNNIAGQSPRIIATGTDANVGLALQTKGSGTVFTRYGGTARDVVDVSSVQSVSNKALVAPGIADFSNAQHAHTDAATGGLLSAASFTPGSGVARVLFANTADSTAIVNTTTATPFDTANYATTFNSIAAVGQLLRLTYCGKFSTTGTPTLQFRLRGSTGPVTLLVGPAITTPSGVSDEMWSASFLLCVRAIGGGGSILATLPHPIVLGASEGRVPGTETAYDFSIDGATATNIELVATWGTADPANTITLEQCVIESLN